jgi:hypothetical protein
MCDKTTPQDDAAMSPASAGSVSPVPAWADDFGREIACYLYGISALRHGLTMPGDFIPCVSTALRAGFASGQIRLPASSPQVPRK